MKPLTILITCLAGLVQSRELYADSNRCLGELGCFPITSDFYHPIWRVINVPVDSREKIRTTFLFHTNRNVDEAIRLVGYEINADALDKIHFDPTAPTKFIVHGFLDNQFFGEWMSKIKDELLKSGKFNVFIVDWSGGNGLPYAQATANTRVVGAEIAVLVKKLQKKFHISLDSVHLYGHSLGAHVIGYAGAGLEGKAGRLTGMDPAEPYFQHLPPSVRLDTSDGQFVEAIHTDSRSFVTNLGLGFSEPLGHLDFFPNGGEVMPGCGIGDRIRDITIDGIKGVAKFSACNHIMAVLYTKEFIRTKNNCVPIAFECQNYDLFKKGQCYDCGHDGSKCAPVSYGSMDYFKKYANSSKTVKMYFDTAPSGSYCMFQYNVQLTMRRYQLRNPNKVASSISGTYQLKLIGTLKSEEFTCHPTTSNLVAGSINKLLIKTTNNLGEIKSVSFRYTGRLIFPPTMELESIKVTPMNVAVPRPNLKALITTVCPSEALQSRREYTWSRESCNLV